MSTDTGAFEEPGPWMGRCHLAESILDHRRFCTTCQPHVDQALDALRGWSISEISNMERG